MTKFISQTTVLIGRIYVCRHDVIQFYLNGKWEEGYIWRTDQNVDESLSKISFKLDKFPGQFIASCHQLIAYEFSGISRKYRIYHQAKPPSIYDI